VRKSSIVPVYRVNVHLKDGTNKFLPNVISQFSTGTFYTFRDWNGGHHAIAYDQIATISMNPQTDWKKSKKRIIWQKVLRKKIVPFKLEV
jgi:hypothetical protein